METVKAIIIDDEKKALLYLSNKLKEQFPNRIEISNTYTSCKEALRELQLFTPDLLFLDITMPLMDGFELLKELNKPELPVIFTTGHEEHAIKAVNDQAVGYLLKPINSKTLKKVVGKTIEAIRDHKLLEQKVNIIESLNTSKKSLCISAVDSIEIINFDEISYLCGEKGYTKIYIIGNTEILSSKNLGFYRNVLDASNFYEIHRSYIININQIRKYYREGFVEMKNGAQLPVSKTKRKEFLDFLAGIL